MNHWENQPLPPITVTVRRGDKVIHTYPLDADTPMSWVGPWTVATGHLLGTATGVDRVVVHASNGDSYTYEKAGHL